MRSKILFTVIGLLGIEFLPAQTGAPLSLTQLIEIGRRNNSSVQIAERRLAAARASRSGTFSGLIPSVRLSTRRNLNDVFDVGSGTGFVIPLKPYGGGLSINQTIFDGGQSWYNTRSGAISVANAEAALERADQGTILEIKEAYFNYLTRLELLQVAEEALALSRRQLGLVEERYRLQAAKETDLLKARRAVGEQERNVYLAQQNLSGATIRMNVAIGLDPQAAIQVARDSVVIEAIPDRERVLSDMMQNNPELKAQELAVEESWLNVKKRRGGLLPSVSFGYSASYSGDDLGNLYADPTTSSSLSLSFPLFSGLQNSSQYASSRQYALAEEATLEQKERQLKAQLGNVLANLEALHRIHPVNQEVLVSAEADVRLAEEQYNLGAISILDLLDAQVALMQARSSIVQTTYNIKTAEAQLAALTGMINQ